MNKHYLIMGAFALDYFMEEVHPELDMDDNVSLIVLNNATEIAEKIAKVIKDNCEVHNESKREIEELFLNDMADYFFHHMFVQDVTGLDAELENFIKISYRLVGDLEIGKIIQDTLHRNGVDIIVNTAEFYKTNN